MLANQSFVNYAHRGASTYTPENTLMAFYTGLYMGANGIETDVQRTKDGVLVLFHDRTVDRVTNGTGKLSDYTYAQLQELNVHNNGLVDKIPTFEDFLRHFAFRDIVFAIELKGEGVEKETADMLRKYNLLKKTVVTSSNLDHLRNFRAYAPEFETGYLVEDQPFTPELENLFKELGITEFCPEIKDATPELVAHWHEMGFRVRGWGARNEDLMRHAYNCGMDGMTVNFPDKLTTLLQEVKK